MRLRRAAGVFFVLIPVSFLMCGLAYGGTVTASGAGPLLPDAEDLSGTGVTEIQGSLSSDPTAVSLFEIDIMNPLDFSAFTVDAGPFEIPDTELFLFDSTGQGVYFNDDDSAGDTLSCLPSADLTNPCATDADGLGPQTAGIYYLAITRSADGPLDASDNEIFTNVLSTDVVGPNSGVGALAGWDDGAFTQPNFDLVNYDILLTGTTPEPATWILAASALGIAGLLRRRGRTRCA
jgi:MYXO-CTERM domain-containing protein